MGKATRDNLSFILKFFICVFLPSFVPFFLLPYDVHYVFDTLILAKSISPRVTCVNNPTPNELTNNLAGNCDLRAYAQPKPFQSSSP